MQALSQLSYSPDTWENTEDWEDPGLGAGTSLLKEARLRNPGSRLDAGRPPSGFRASAAGPPGGRPPPTRRPSPPAASSSSAARSATARAAAPRVSGCRASSRAPPARGRDSSASTRERRWRPAPRGGARAAAHDVGRELGHVDCAVGRGRARGAPRSRAAARCRATGSAMSFAIAARVTFTARPGRACVAKCSTSSGMSSGRSRSGGTRRVMTLSR